MRSPLQDHLDALHGRLAGLRDGQLADYIPELARVNPDSFGICLVTMDGAAYAVGDCDQPFTIQSISKPFVYGLALEDRGWEIVGQKVGAATELRQFAAGSLVVELGDKGDGHFFFIQSGQVSVLVPLQSGGHMRIASLGPGMNFGEMALAGQSLRTASVHADTEVCCRVLDISDFNRICDEFPELRVALLENLTIDLGNKLRRATQWISALA